MPYEGPGRERRVRRAVYEKEKAVAPVEEEPVELEAAEAAPDAKELTHAEQVQALHRSVEDLTDVISSKRSEIMELEQEALGRSSQTARAKAFKLERDEAGNITGRGDAGEHLDVHERINRAEKELKAAESELHARTKVEPSHEEALRQLAKAARAEIQQLEKEALHPGSKSTPAFEARTLIYDEKGHVIGRGVKEVAPSAENLVTAAEDKLRGIETRLREHLNPPVETVASRPRLEVPKAVNDNWEGIQNEVMPPGSGVLSSIAGSGRLRRFGLTFAAFLGLGQPLAAHVLYETPEANQIERMSTKVVAEKGEGGDKLFAKLKATIEHEYKVDGGKPTPLEKYILKSDPHKLSVAFKFTDGRHSALVYKGDSLEIKGGRLVSHHGNKSITLMEEAASQKEGVRVVGTFAPTRAREAHVKVHYGHHKRAVSHAAEHSGRESEQTVKDIYAYEKEHGGLPGIGAEESFRAFLARTKEGKGVEAVPVAKGEAAPMAQAPVSTESLPTAERPPAPQHTEAPRGDEWVNTYGTRISEKVPAVYKDTGGRLRTHGGDFEAQWVKAREHVHLNPGATVFVARTVEDIATHVRKVQVAKFTSNKSGVVGPVEWETETESAASRSAGSDFVQRLP